MYLYTNHRCTFKRLGKIKNLIPNSLGGNVAIVHLGGQRQMYVSINPKTVYNFSLWLEDDDPELAYHIFSDQLTKEYRKEQERLKDKYYKKLDKLRDSYKQSLA